MIVIVSDEVHKRLFHFWRRFFVFDLLESVEFGLVFIPSCENTIFSEYLILMSTTLNRLPMPLPILLIHIISTSE